MYKFVLLMVVCLSFSGCFHDKDDRVNHDQTQKMLDENITKWEQAAIDNYQFHYRLGCFCPPPAGEDLLITVMAGEMTDVVKISDNSAIDTIEWPSFHTVDDMFATIQDAINRSAARISVSYDNDLGYPTSIYIDYWKNAVDEELGITANDLTVL